ncbi:rod shape-determining protein MreD [Lihuaxuella thermophila]|uniref:Rod shape-determining protein MreD n=1 Tax=Lihuaxuella thermophila TaxID=1173111 RepID=A0A1H8FSZ2_9BACL|nr:rod shape-determining protein MreD [Lihuaxuella thermophila]SEN34387.1 rod shape-determining protein MreD [Lihuaxuella thermophila]
MRVFVVCFLFFLFLIQGSVLQWLLPQAWGTSFVVIPQLVLSGIVMLSLYGDEQMAVLFGFGFGLLHDIVYGPAWGISAFSTALTAYAAVLVSRHFPPYPWIAGLTNMVVQWIHLFIIYGWFRLFDFTQMPFFPAISYHIIPSVLFNVVCGFPIYFLISRIYRKNEQNTIQLFG